MRKATTKAGVRRLRWNAPNGWGYSRPVGGWEYPMLWLVAQASLAIVGSGAFAMRGSESRNY